MIGTFVLGFMVGMMVEFICIVLIVSYFAKENRKNEEYNEITGRNIRNGA